MNLWNELRSLARQVAALKQALDQVLTLRQGTVTDTGAGSVTVTLGGSTTAIPGVKYFDSYSPTVSDTVWVFRNGADLIVLGTLA